MLFIAFWPLGALLGPSGALLGASGGPWSPPGRSRVALEVLSTSLGGSCGSLGALLKPLGALLAVLGRLLGCS